MHWLQQSMLCGVCLLVSVAHLTVSMATAAPMGVEMEWDYTQGDPATTEQATGFRVYQQPDCTGAFVRLDDIVTVTTRTYTARSLTAGKTYCWQVTALGAQGGESEPSNSISFRVSNPPAKAINLRGKLVP